MRCSPRRARITPVYGSSPPRAAAEDREPGERINENDDDEDDYFDRENDDPPEWLSSPGPSCSLVEFAGVRLLLNVGWDESMPTPPPPSSSSRTSPDFVANDGIGGGRSDDGNYVVAAKPPGDVDAVLICDSTLSSLGGLPVFFGDR